MGALGGSLGGGLRPHAQAGRSSSPAEGTQAGPQRAGWGGRWAVLSEGIREGFLEEVAFEVGLEG